MKAIIALNLNQNAAEEATAVSSPGSESTKKASIFLNHDPNRINPMTQFWTTYEKVADGYDSDVVAQLVGDLGTSLPFVSAFATLYIFSLT